MTALTLGFIPLTDCAPLIVARDKGFFADEGLDVTLSREASWATIRDKVAYGALDGAHMLGPMALAATLVAGRETAAMIAPLALNRNGAGITVSLALAERLATASLAEIVAARRAAGQTPLTFAVVFAFSIHNYALRGWLADAGVDPDRDVRVVVTPPPRMVDQLADGQIDGFCVGAPWNAVAMETGAGRTLVATSAILPDAPDKVLGVSAAWAARNPGPLAGLLRALSRAGAWADQPRNRDELIGLLAHPGAVGVAASAIAGALGGEIVFHAGGASVPTRMDALWILSQMQRWGQVGSDVDPAILDEVFRPDLLEQALAATR